MARERGPRLKLERREQVDLETLSGIRSRESKAKKTLPGQHGGTQNRLTEYGKQFRAKQVLRRIYGVQEKQFHNYYVAASKGKGSTGENLILMLESRLDNMVYRLGFASTRREARQIVKHKAVLVNDKVVDIPSYLVSVNDKITITEKAKKQSRILSAIALADQNQKSFDWIKANRSEFSGELMRMPELKDFPAHYNVNLVVELYSK